MCTESERERMDVGALFVKRHSWTNQVPVSIFLVKPIVNEVCSNVDDCTV